MTSSTTSETGTVRVWDPLVRIFHWSLVASFTVAWLSGEGEALSLHVGSGYLVGGLILFRLLWGFVGPTHARFRDFVFSPAKVLAYTQDLLHRRARRYLGHNPLGGAMVVALLVMLALATVSGFAAYAAKEGAGPLVSVVPVAPKDTQEVFEEVHEALSNLTLILIFLHIAGVLVGSLVHRENLVRAMITGRKHT